MTARWNFIPYLDRPEPVRCLCSHSPVVHVERTSECMSAACGCRFVRFPSVEASMANHPSGKGLK